MKLQESSRALLENCSTTEEIDDTIEDIVEMKREAALRSYDIEEEDEDSRDLRESIERSSKTSKRSEIDEKCKAAVESMFSH